MRKSFFLGIFLLVVHFCFSQEVSTASTKMFRLAAPQLRTSAVFFDSSITVSLDFDFPNVDIRYSLDGSTVNGSSMKYSGPFRLSKSATISAKAFHPDFLESMTVQRTVLKISKKGTLKNIVVSPDANEKYTGSGAKGLMDLKKGGKSYTVDPQWMGFQADSLRARITLDGNTKVSTLIISTLNDQSSWIFEPKEVKIFAEDKLIGAYVVPNSGDEHPRSDVLIQIPVVEGVYAVLDLIIYPLKKIPEWHQGKGSKPWFFMDEIILQ